MLKAMKSRDAGKTLLQTLFFFLLVTQTCFAQWYQQNSGTSANLNSVYFENANIGWAVGNSGVIIKTTNGGVDWTSQESGTLNSIRGVCFIDANNGWAVGDSGTIIHTADGGYDWVPQTSGTSIELNSVYFLDINNGWADGGNYRYDSTSHYDGILIHTIDGGANWTSMRTDSMIILRRVYFLNMDTGFAVGDFNIGFGIMRGIILRTTNGGVSWDTTIIYPSDLEGIGNSGSKATEQKSPDCLPNSHLSFVQFTDNQTGWVVGWVGCLNIGDIAIEGIILNTNDGGISWQENARIGYIYLNSVHFVNSSTGWVAGIGEFSGSDIYFTVDGGSNWSLQFPHVEQSLNDIYFVDQMNGWTVGSGGTILHTTNGGVVPVELTAFTATANGKEITLNWSTATELNNQGFEVQRKFGRNTFVTIGSVKGQGTTTSPNNYTYSDKLIEAGKYFYRLKQIDFGGKYKYSREVEVNWSPFTTYKLEQNYPNPFNPTTTIGFGIPNKSNVRLSVLNILGEEIRVLLNEEMEAGYHSVDFNGSDLPSGVYFYQLKVYPANGGAGEFIQTRKMILIK